MSHKFGAMVVPYLVDGKIGYNFCKICIDLFESIYSVEFVISIFGRDASKVLVINCKFISEFFQLSRSKLVHRIKQRSRYDIFAYVKASS